MVMWSIHEEQQGRRSDEDYVKHPESVMGDGESHVITHLFASWLEGVASKLLLFIVKQVTGHSSKNQYPKHEHEQEPKASKHRRVSLEAVKEPPEEAPFAHDCGSVRFGWMEIWRLIHPSFSEQKLPLTKKETKIDVIISKSWLRRTRS